MIDRLEVFSRSTLEDYVVDARSRTLALVADLSDEQFRVPLLRIINPPLWEIGHVAYFQEYWVLRHASGRQPIMSSYDSLYDSAKVAHDTRWDLPLPSRAFGIGARPGARSNEQSAFRWTRRIFRHALPIA